MTKPDAKREDRETRSSRKTDILVFAVLSLVASTAFAIQAWMTFGFGREVWILPVELSAALVFALDIFAIMFMILTYLLRGTGAPRLFATVVFVAAIGAQVFAAELFGKHKDWPTEVRWFSTIPAVFLALSQEGVILYRNNRPGQDRPERRVVEMEPQRRPATRPEDTSPIKAEVIKPAPKPVEAPKPKAVTASPQVRTAKPSAGQQGIRDAFAKRSIAGERTIDLAREAQTSTRSIQNWVKDYQERHPKTPGDQQKQPVNSPVNTPVNGHAFTPAKEVQQ